MKHNLFAAAAVVAATLAGASLAQTPNDTGSRPSQAAAPMTHLTIGIVRSIDATGSGVTIDHQAIPSLGMPAMTMQFQFSPSSKVGLKPGQSIAFTFTASADGLTIGSAQLIPGAGNAVPQSSAAASSMPNMDHSDMAGAAGMMDSCQEVMRVKR